MRCLPWWGWKRGALLAMEKAGTATRVKGGKPGIPDTWTLADATQADVGSADGGAEDEQGDQPADGTASSPDGHGDETADEAGHDKAAETASPEQQDADADAAPEAADDDAVQVRRHPLTDLRGWDDRVAGVGDDRLDRRLFVERRPSRQKKVGDRAQRVDVAPRVEQLRAGRLLGRHV